MTNVTTKVIMTIGDPIEQEFPVLMKAKKNEMIVLMTKTGEGTVLVPNEFYEVGDHNNDWSMSSFKRFSGVIQVEGK